MFEKGKEFQFNALGYGNIISGNKVAIKHQV
jgi:hypothetical protein